MKILVTGSAGQLGEAIVRKVQNTRHDVVGLDRLASAYTVHVGCAANREFVSRWVRGVDAIIHAATLHQPHSVTHSPQEFIDTNVMGTLNLLEETAAAGVVSFVFAFGAALTPPAGAPAAWVTKDARPIPRNICGVTKVAAEDLCDLFHRSRRLACVVMRTSRFSPEENDNVAIRESYEDFNVTVNEFLFRRVDLQAVVDAHLLAIEKAPPIGFGRYIISATTSFEHNDLPELRVNAVRVLSRRGPEYEEEYARRGWTMFPEVERVYVNERAQRELGWRPRHSLRGAPPRCRRRSPRHAFRAGIDAEDGQRAERPDNGPA